MFGKATPFRNIKSITRARDDRRIDRAKQYPIEKLYIERLGSRYMKRTGDTIMCICCFHSEETPSLAIYTKTNTFHCFGCRASGDAITFYMRLYKTDFQTALQELTA